MTVLASILAAASGLSCVTGTVSFVTRQGEEAGVLVPESGAPAFWFVGAPQSRRQAESEARRLVPGDRLELRGVWKDLAFAPGLVVSSIVRLGRGDLGPAPERSLAEFAGGRLDNTRATLRGVLTAVHPSLEPGYAYLTLATPDGPFVAEVPAAARDWQTLVDCSLRMEGVASSSFNIRREFNGVLLRVLADEHVTVERPSDDPFARPLTPLGSILSYSPAPADLHRRHVTGVVTYAKPGEFLWLADDGATLKVNTAETSVRAGDVVEAVGFATRAYGLGRLVAASVRKVGTHALPEPVPVAWNELAGYPFDDSGHYVSYDGKWVTCTGRLLSCIPTERGTELKILCDGVQVSVLVDEPLTGVSSRDVAWGASLDVTGVLELEEAPGKLDGPLPAIGGWTIRVAKAADIALVRDAAWQAHRAAEAGQMVLIVLGGVLCLLLGFGIVALVRMRGQKRALDLLATERKRMAADLHDTLEQQLATTRMVLNSAVSFSPNVPETVRKAVAEANVLLAHAKSEMRARIFNMRSDVLFTQEPAQVLRTLARKVASRNLRVHTRLRGLPERIPEAVFSELVFIVGEAITNAVKHGKCRTLVLASDPTPKGFALSVANDGEPFDPETALGPEAGHYGLVGMRERARRAGIGLDFAHVDRWMVVRLTL